MARTSEPVQEPVRLIGYRQFCQRKADAGERPELLAMFAKRLVDTNHEVATEEDFNSLLASFRISPI